MWCDLTIESMCCQNLKQEVVMLGILLILPHGAGTV